MRQVLMNSAVLVWAYAAALAACAAAAVVPWALRRWWYRDRAKLAAEPQCLQCGYIIRRGSSVVCPECGSDVRQHGIVTPKTLPPLPRWPWYGLAVLLGPGMGWQLGAAVAEWQPFGWEFSVVRVVYLPGQLLSGAPSDADDVYTVYASGTGRYFRKRAGRVDVWSRERVLPLRYPFYQRAAHGVRLSLKGSFEPGSVASVVKSTAGTGAEGDLGAASVAVEDAVRAMTSGDFPSGEGTTYGERWNQDVRYKLLPGARRVVAGVGASVSLVIPVCLVRRALRPRRASRRDEWALAARELSLYVPKQAAA